MALSIFRVPIPPGHWGISQAVGPQYGAIADEGLPGVELLTRLFEISSGLTQCKECRTVANSCSDI